MEPEFIQPGMVSINQRRLARIKVKDERCKAGLWLPCLASMTESLVANALVKRVLIDEQQFILRLDEDVRVSKLRQWLHVGQFVELPFERPFVLRPTRRAQSCMSVQVAFGRRKRGCHRLFTLTWEQGLTQRRGGNRALLLNRCRFFSGLSNQIQLLPCSYSPCGG